MIGHFTAVLVAERAEVVGMDDSRKGNEMNKDPQ